MIDENIDMTDQPQSLPPAMSARFREERQRIGMTQADIAHAAGVYLKTIGRFELGKNAVSVLVLEKCAGVGMDVNYVLTGRRIAQAASAAPCANEECSSLRATVRQVVREEMAADAAQKAEKHRAQMDLQLELRKRRDRAHDLGVVEPSLLDLLTLPPDPPPLALLRAAGRHDLAEACASHPTAQARSEAGHQPPADQGASQ
ncbi:helix-turn-helix domain-containing protein [Algiphilus sp.]|uniref:helix-turn-helix domain-containing protein n=1 Tax=Algiphilus sp. TaxID=1872431 RepID=UPI003C6719FC